jgi:hypothetical protein
MEMENKSLPTKFKMMISISTLLGVLLAFNQCVLKPNTKSAKKTSIDLSNPLNPVTNDAGDIHAPVKLPAGVDLPPMNAPIQNTEMADVKVGVKNFDQLNMTMSKLTGVPTSDKAIMAVFKETEIQMPADNNIKNFMPSTQVAITKLATEYCSKLVDTDALRKMIWTSIDFTKTPDQTLTVANKNKLIDETIMHFLGPVETESITNAKTELLGLYDILISGESMTANLTTLKVVKGICVASLSSAYVTLL